MTRLCLAVLAATLLTACLYGCNGDSTKANAGNTTPVVSKGGAQASGGIKATRPPGVVDPVAGSRTKGAGGP